MDATELLLRAAEKTVTAITVPLTNSILSFFSGSRGEVIDFEGAISSHLNSVARWSSQLQMHGLPEPKATSTESISLGIAKAARRFAKSGERNCIADLDLLADNKHYLLLGDPGSGKTTTMKRMAVHVLTEDAEDGDRSTFEYPLVIRLRELQYREHDAPGTTGQQWHLLRLIATVLGLPLRPRTKYDDRGHVIDIYWEIADRPIAEVVTRVLDDTNALLLLDGFDELDPREADNVHKEIQTILYSVRNCKLVLTCRTGEYSRQLEGISVVEILPLTPAQVAQVAATWISNVDEFQEVLQTVPYADIANRPLLLCQLLFLFQRYGTLPERAALAYRKSVRVLIEEWDANNLVHRKSKYSGFTPERKYDFLVDLAHDLTLRTRRISFTESDLEESYKLLEIISKLVLLLIWKLA